jgi:hypothetical protein
MSRVRTAEFEHGDQLELAVRRELPAPERDHPAADSGAERILQLLMGDGKRVRRRVAIMRIVFPQFQTIAAWAGGKTAGGAGR